ncbi:MAG TPA: MFS transporter [Bordetella sp.]
MTLGRGRARHILPVIVISQFGGTSLWFAGNAVAGDLAAGLSPAYAASAVQLGFIAGTLFSARLRLADRYAAPALFFVCCLLGALFNYPVTALARGAGGYAVPAVLAARFVVGLTLAGIYPVGIKVAAGWYREGLGGALGYLTGALVLGTAFPHMVRGLGAAVPWNAVLAAASMAAVAGGALLWALVAEGPYVAPRLARDAIRPQVVPGFSPWSAVRRQARLRASACGYFGHMWELYAFWAFLPVVLAAHGTVDAWTTELVSRWSFAVIAVGAIGCIVGGLVANRRGSAPVALACLVVSGVCCLASPWAYGLPMPAFLAFLAVWGIAVVGDSPQFSALNALESPRNQVGSVVTLVNSIGFAITVVSIQLLAWLLPAIGPRWLLLPLVAGPVVGCLVFAQGYFRASRD